MPKKATEPPAVIRISTNTIIGNKFYVMDDPLPFARVEDLPENLRPLVVSDELEPEEPNRPRGNFQLGEVYEMTDDGRLGRTLRRRVERQVAQLQAENDYEEQLEEEAANAELPPEVADDLQAQHRAHVDMQAAQMSAAARAADDIADAAAAAQEPPRLYVKRGGRHYAPAHKARLKPGEDVFVKDPADGTFQFIGTTDSRAEPPDTPIPL